MFFSHQFNHKNVPSCHARNAAAFRPSRQESRKERQRRIDAGDETVRLKLLAALLEPCVVRRDLIVVNNDHCIHYPVAMDCNGQ